MTNREGFPRPSMRDLRIRRSLWRHAKDDDTTTSGRVLQRRAAVLSMQHLECSSKRLGRLAETEEGYSGPHPRTGTIKCLFQWRLRQQNANRTAAKVRVSREGFVSSARRGSGRD